jgi:glycine/D-amino acid oxidase-like deaminating enzyme
MPSYDIIVIGCGVAGAATAYHLKTKGAASVLVIESGAGPACGPTGKSAGVVRMHYSHPILVRMAIESREMFANMEAMLGKDGGFRRKGWWLAVGANMIDQVRANIEMQRGLGLNAELLSPNEIPGRAPWLNPEDVAGLLYEPESGYADPVQTTEAFAFAFQNKGGAIRFKTPVRSLIRKGDRVSGVMLDDGPVHADIVVNAAGPWTKMLAATIGLEMDLRAVREQDAVWEVRAGRPMPECSFSTTIEAAYCRALGGNRFILGLGFPKPYFDVDPYNYKTTIDDEILALSFDKNAKRLPNLQGAKLIHSYASLYDITKDFYPYAGPRSGLAGYFEYCGGSGHGFKIAPAIAGHLADWILRGRTSPEFAQLSYDRVAAGNLFGGLGGNRG